MPQSANAAPGFATLAIHAGAAPDPSTGARVTPIYQTTSYVFNDVDHAASLFGLEAFGNIYTRIGGPTQAVLEQRIAALEGGTAALAVASGHAAQAIVFHTLLEPGDEFVAGRQLYGGSVNQFNHSFKKFDWRVKWADATDPASFAKAVTGKTQGDLLRVDRQSRRHRRRPAGDRRHRQEGRRAADRRQHAGDALPVPAQGVRRRHHRALAHQVHGRARQLDRRRHRRLRHLRLAQRQAQVCDARRSQPQLQRHAAGRDLRQLRLRHCLPRAGPARPGAGDLALQCVPDPDGHRDAAPAHGEALRERGRGCQVSGQAQPSGMGELRRFAQQQIPRHWPRRSAPRARAPSSPSASRAATRPASSSSPTSSCSRTWPTSATSGASSSTRPPPPTASSPTSSAKPPAPAPTWSASPSASRTPPTSSPT